MVKIAFAGFRHGHINALYQMAVTSKDVDVVGAFEQDDGARAAAEKDLGVKFNYAAYDELLNDKNVDVVAIGDYFGIRGKRAIDALNAGKHVFADKPLCTSIGELDEIERVSAAKNLKVGCMLDMRYNHFVEYVRNLVAGGKLGKVRTISFGGQHPLFYGTRPAWYYEAGKHCGVINDIAVHGIDIIYHMFGLEVVRVVGAREWNAFAVNDPGFKDCGQFIAELTGGVGLMADISYSFPNSIGYTHPNYWRFSVVCDKGTIEFGPNFKEIRIGLDGRDGIEHVIPPAVNTGDCLSVFVKELAGEPTAINTAVVIKSSRGTLKIQAAADAAK